MSFLEVKVQSMLRPDEVAHLLCWNKGNYTWSTGRYKSINEPIGIITGAMNDTWIYTLDIVGLVASLTILRL